MKKTVFTFLAVLLLALMAVPANAQIGAFWYGGVQPVSCNAGVLGMDITSGRLYACPNGTTASGWQGDVHLLGQFQGVTSTSITTGNFTVLTGPTIKIPAATVNLAGKHLRVRFRGVYTTAAASLLNTDIALCTVAGCGSGTVFSAAGCVVVSTNQANVLANGQFRGECELIVATTGASATLMAKANSSFNLGAATSAAMSEFDDTATAVSAAVDLTVDEYIYPRFKFTTSNAGNAATIQSYTVEVTD